MPMLAKQGRWREGQAWAHSAEYAIGLPFVQVGAPAPPSEDGSALRLLRYVQYCCTVPLTRLVTRRGTYRKHTHTKDPCPHFPHFFAV